MGKVLEHKGVVVEVEGERVDVSIVSHSGCGSCKVKELCGMSEEEEKLISLFLPYSRIFEKGEEVVVEISRIMGIKAALYAYAFPFLVMLVSLTVFSKLNFSELKAGLLTLGSAVLYYVVLFFFRKRIEREITFKIRKI